jgi:hypothetical protein
VTVEEEEEVERGSGPINSLPSQTAAMIGCRFSSVGGWVGVGGC